MHAAQKLEVKEAAENLKEAEAKLDD